VAPQGFHLWVSGLSRKVSVVSKSEYLTAVHGILTTSRTHIAAAHTSTNVKNYTAELPILEKGKFHLFAKYDF
jgi:hypothetical protein